MGYAVEKVKKWERSKGLSLRVYTVRKSKTSQESREHNFKKEESQAKMVFKMTE